LNWFAARHYLLVLAGALTCLMSFGAVHTQPSGTEDVYLKLTTVGRERIRLVMALASLEPEPPPEAGVAAHDIQNVLEADLAFSLYFSIVDPPEEATVPADMDSKLDLRPWISSGAQFLLISSLSGRASPWTFRVGVYDLSLRRRIFTRTYRIDPDVRTHIHRTSDDLIRLLTGEAGVSQTRIAYSIVRGENREIACVDYDGYNPHTLTRHKSTSISPAWSPTGDRLAYTIYQDRNPNLMVLDLQTERYETVSRQPGLNTSPAWAPDGKRLAVTLSKDGNPEIYTLDVNGKDFHRITASFAIDTSPDWSPSGHEVAFVSDRSGSPQIYVMGADGSNVRRITHTGAYNTSPAWSPRGDRIAYVSREENGHQIYVIDLSGNPSEPVRLTNRGNNEDPCWSPDGLHIAFSSNRTGAYQIYTMHYDGSGQRMITSGPDARSPSWSPGSAAEQLRAEE
jgi:TolB protein